ncbi:MAG: VWA domain-containing protein, partial [Pyrinomonadaceae bacterium]
ALAEGRKTFEPGLLARANRGFLYIDEVNLLEDHLIDLLLDVAVTGRNIVEREGISIEHPARFVLIGSGNPEEGELRPQLQDRFGLSVEVKTETDAESRVSIVVQREAFDRNPAAFRAALEAEQEQLRRRLLRAQKSARNVRIPPELLRSIAQLCSHLKIDGHRGELTITRAARALAALEGRRDASAGDVRRVAPMSLRHRLRRDPLEQTASDVRIEEALEKFLPQNSVDKKRAKGKRGGGGHTPFDEDGASGNHQQTRETEITAPNASQKKSESGSLNAEEQNPSSLSLDAKMSAPIASNNPQPQQRRPNTSHAARRQQGTRQSIYNTQRGRYSRAIVNKTDGAKIALDATLRAVAGVGELSVSGYNGQRTTDNGQIFSPVSRAALRYKLFKRREGTLFIFAVDASGSMALSRIALAKGALTRLLRQSYLKRDRVALISFRGDGAEVLMSPGRSVTRARRLLDSLAVGGATPLGASLIAALEIGKRAARQGAGKIVTLVFTDGRANVLLQTKEAMDRPSRQKLIERELEHLGALFRSSGIELVVVDTQNRFTSNGEARTLARLTGGRYTEVSPAIFSSTVEPLEI